MSQHETQFAFRSQRSRGDPVDTALENLSTEQLYRMLELLDMVEKQKELEMESATQKEIDTLKYLMENVNVE